MQVNHFLLMVNQCRLRGSQPRDNLRKVSQPVKGNQCRVKASQQDNLRGLRDSRRIHQASEQDSYRNRHS